MRTFRATVTRRARLTLWTLRPLRARLALIARKTLRTCLALIALWTFRPFGAVSARHASLSGVALLSGRTLWTLGTVSTRRTVSSITAGRPLLSRCAVIAVHACRTFRPRLSILTRLARFTLDASRPLRAGIAPVALVPLRPLRTFGTLRASVPTITLSTWCAIGTRITLRPCRTLRAGIALLPILARLTGRTIGTG
ncbi:hypothetical protein [Microtetraspora malaysiensis]|uniref:hypothetical protein n=1 Tax=Microtetraspora malaysiensis TaxID=161358 RepID=UPI003D936ADD